MKLIRVIAIVTLSLFSLWVYPQSGGPDTDSRGFYQRMALSDAEREESLSFISQEDEADYWKDQLEFEKQLKEREYSAYKAYIFFKRKAYQDHQSECDIAVKHGKGYNRQAVFYSTQGLIGDSGLSDVSGVSRPVSNLASQRY